MKEETITKIEEPKETYQMATKTEEAVMVEGLELEVAPTKGEINLANNDIVYEGEYIKYNIKVTNTSNQSINNVKIEGTIPEGTIYGELEADYYNQSGKYEYHFDPEIKTKEIEIGTIKPGESKTVFYEVQVNDLIENIEEQTTKTNIQAKVGEVKTAQFEINNIIKKADLKVFMKANLYGHRDAWNYYIYVKSKEEKKVPVTIKLPKELQAKYFYDEGISLEYDENNTPKDNLFEFEVDTNKEYYLRGVFNRSKLTQITEESRIILYASATVTSNDITYQSNETRILVEYENVNVSMTSENEGQGCRSTTKALEGKRMASQTLW